MDNRNQKLYNALIEYLEPRFNKIETDVSELKKDVSELKKDVSLLKLEVLNINKYISQENEVKEIKANKMFEDFLEKKNIKFKKIDWRLVYDFNGLLVTDLDGCYLLNPKINNRKVLNSQNFGKRGINENTIQQIINYNKTRDTEFNLPQRLVIIESKSFFDKYQIDKKIKQLFLIHQILVQSQNQENEPHLQGHIRFRDMVQLYNLQSLPLDVYLVISGHLKHEMLNYILKCNEGITEEEYNDFELKSLLDSYEFKKASKTILNFNLRIKTENLQQFINSLNNEIKKNSNNIFLNNLKKQIKSFRDIEQYLNFCRGKIGYLFYDKEYLDYLNRFY